MRRRCTQRSGPTSATSDREGLASEEHAEANVNTDWSNLLDSEQPKTTLRNFLSDAARALAPDERAAPRWSAGFIALDTLLSAAECERLMAASESVGYGVTNYNQEYRGNLRMISTDDGMAAAVFDRIKPFVPERVDGVDMQGEPCARRLSGLNECWRWAKRRPSDRFGAHCDANFVRTDNEVSLFTLNIYLNAVPGGRRRHAFLPGEPEALRRRAHGGTVDLAARPPPAPPSSSCSRRRRTCSTMESASSATARASTFCAATSCTGGRRAEDPGPLDADYVPDPDGK